MRQLRQTKAVRLVLSLAAFALVLLTALPAFSFGTINGMGQHAEHEKVTRLALACAPGANPDTCLQPDTLDEIAGTDGDFGAVGAPDRGAMTFEPAAHCDSADYMDIPGYPQTREQAQARLLNCRAWMMSHISAAVDAAAELLDDDGDIRSSQIPTIIDCVFVGGRPGRAKCNVIEHLGVMLHAAQDFYSHSNWVDRPDPSRSVSQENPTGLDHDGPSPWLDLRNLSPEFPDGLITGLANVSGCLQGNCGGQAPDNGEVLRVSHDVLNKDTGDILLTGSIGTTRRGAVEGNFDRAVRAAVADTQDKWLTFNEMLIARYGPERGATMICAITRDHPNRDCPHG